MCSYISTLNNVNILFNFMLPILHVDSSSYAFHRFVLWAQRMFSPALGRRWRGVGELNDKYTMCLFMYVRCDLVTFFITHMYVHHAWRVKQRDSGSTDELHKQTSKSTALHGGLCQKVQLEVSIWCCMTSSSHRRLFSAFGLYLFLPGPVRHWWWSDNG